MRHLLAMAAALALALFTFQTAGAHGFKAGKLEIGHPNTRAMLPGAKVAGGYLKISNEGPDADRLISVSSERARVVQLHEMKVENDVMTMREVAGGIAIPAGETVKLAKGGYHVMFMDIAEPFREGEMIKARLVFEKAGAVDVEFAVGPAGEQASKGAPAADAHTAATGHAMP